LRDFAPNAAAILLTEPAERWSVRLKVPGLLGDIVIVFVDDDPAALEVAEACPPDSISETSCAIHRRAGLGRDRQKCQMDEAVVGSTRRDHDAGRTPAGVEFVEDHLDRLEYGVYA
jgi:hypothetical protein